MICCQYSSKSKYCWLRRTYPCVKLPAMATPELFCGPWKLQHAIRPVSSYNATPLEKVMSSFAACGTPCTGDHERCSPTPGCGWSIRNKVLMLSSTQQETQPVDLLPPSVGSYTCIIGGTYSTRTSMRSTRTARAG